MSRALEAAPAADAGIDAARYYRDQVASRLEEMRSIIDRMEPLVGADYWPYPTYADILFLSLIHISSAPERRTSTTCWRIRRTSPATTSTTASCKPTSPP